MVMGTVGVLFLFAWIFGIVPGGTGLFLFIGSIVVSGLLWSLTGWRS